MNIMRPSQRKGEKVINTTKPAKVLGWYEVKFHIVGPSFQRTLVHADDVYVDSNCIFLEKDHALVGVYPVGKTAIRRMAEEEV